MDINRLLAGTASPDHTKLFTFFPAFDDEEIESQSGEFGAHTLFDDGSYTYSSDVDDITFENKSNELHTWTVSLTTSSSGTISNGAYNPITDTISFVRPYGGGTGLPNIWCLIRATGGESWNKDLRNEFVVETGQTFVPQSCKIDSYGNTYVLGLIQTSPKTIGIVKLDREGTILWSYSKATISGSSNDEMHFDVGFIGGDEGIVIGVNQLTSENANLFIYNLTGSLRWKKDIPSYYGGGILDYNGVCAIRIHEESHDIFLAMDTFWQGMGGGSPPGTGFKTHYRINGGTGGIIWSLSLLEDPTNQKSERFLGLDYDDSGNLWCGYYSFYLSSTKIKKVSGGGSSLEDIDVDSFYYSIIAQVNDLPSYTTTSEPIATTTEEPWPCEISNLFEYGYIEKDGIRILVRKTEGNELKLIRPIPPEWIVGTELKLVPGCNKTLCDCNYKWDDLENFLALGIKMPSSNPLTADTGANPK